MSDTFLASLFAWILGFAGIASAIRMIRSHARRLANDDQRYSPGMLLRDAAAPLGMSLFGFRALILGYGLSDAESLLCRSLLFLATTGIVGGIAAWKIGRLPID